MSAVAHAFRSYVVVAALGATACGDSDTEQPARSTTEPSAATSTTVDEASPDVRRFDAFEARSVQFGNLVYTLEAVRVTNQTLRSLADDAEPEVGDSHHLVIDVRVSNETGRAIESDDESIGLEVGGDRTPLADAFLSDAVGIIRADTSVESFLAFEVDDADEVDLASATVVFGTSPDRPARLPLGGDVPEPELPLSFELTGTSTGVGPTNAGPIEFTALDGAAFADLPHGDTTSPTGERADAGEIFLQIHVRATKTDGRGRDLLSDAFRLLVDGVPRAPFDVATTASGSTPTPTADVGAAVDAWVLFVVPTDGGAFVLQVGDPAEAPGTIPLAVPELPTG